MKIYFSHGKDSGPTGFKINYLISIAEEMQIKTESIDYTSTKNPDERVDILLNSYDKAEENMVLYGSSMGAYVSLTASEIINPKALFLCAPAIFMPEYNVQKFCKLNIPIIIVHGYNDTVVPYKYSIKFAEKHECELHIVNDNHSLSNSQGIIRFLFKDFLESIITESVYKTYQPEFVLIRFSSYNSKTDI